MRVHGIARLTSDPDIRVTQGTEPLTVARYTLIWNRKGSKDIADTVRCVCFGKTAEFVEKYLKKGMKIYIEGRIQSGSYQDKDGKKVYTTDVLVESHEFCEGKKQESAFSAADIPSEFMGVPVEIEEEELPFI